MVVSFAGTSEVVSTKLGSLAAKKCSNHHATGAAEADAQDDHTAMQRLWNRRFRPCGAAVGRISSSIRCRAIRPNLSAGSAGPGGQSQRGRTGRYETISTTAAKLTNSRGTGSVPSADLSNGAT